MLCVCRMMFVFCKETHSFLFQTIGFGDLSPQQPLSKLAAIIFIPFVVAAMGYILGK